MNSLAQTIYLATTNPEFRGALQANPQAATAARGLTLNDEELDALRALQQLLDLSPQELVAVVLSSGDLPPWIAVASEGESLPVC